MSLRVHDADGVEVQLRDGAVRLEEARTYHLDVAAAGDAPRAWLGVRELAWHAGQARFTIVVDHWVGSSMLRVVHMGRETALPVEVAPRIEKLSDAAWLALLGDLEAWSPGIAVGFAGGGVGDVQNEGTPATILAVALLPLVPPLIRAVRAIAAAPREHTTAAREDVPLRTVRKADRETLQWLAHHPAASRAVDPWFVAQAGFQDPYVPQDTSRETVDHPVNRYIAWLIARIARGLGDLGAALARAAKHPRAQPDVAEWCRARASAAALAAEELTAVLRRTFLGALAPMPATEAALLAVHDDPLYARAHALARPFLSPKFRLQESLDAGQAPVKPSFDLYELWTLLAVQRALRAHLVGWSWTWHSEPGHELLAGFREGAHFTASHPDGAQLHVRYNVTFRGYLAGSTSEKFSISGERRPDVVVTFQPPGGEASWICLDAKYRVAREALADSFTSLHIYRDALRWPAFGGQVRGGLLLVPATVSACAPWFAREFREQFGIGAWRLTPGEPIDAALAEVVVAMLAGPRAS